MASLGLNKRLFRPSGKSWLGAWRHTVVKRGFSCSLYLRAYGRWHEGIVKAFSLRSQLSGPTVHKEVPYTTLMIKYSCIRLAFSIVNLLSIWLLLEYFGVFLDERQIQCTVQG